MNPDTPPMSAGQETARKDDTVEVVLDDQGQGFSKVGDLTTHSFWACGFCGRPTGGQERQCRTHPHANLFMRHIREVAP